MQFAKFAEGSLVALMAVFDVMVASPSRSALRWRAWAGSCEMLQSNLCCILLRVVDMVSIIPESCRDVLSLNSDRTRPSCTSACERRVNWELETHMEKFILTSSIRHDLENWRMYLVLATFLCSVSVKAIILWRYLTCPRVSPASSRHWSYSLNMTSWLIDLLSRNVKDQALCRTWGCGAKIVQGGISVMA